MLCYEVGEGWEMVSDPPGHSTHAAQMLEAPLCDPLELETGSFHTWGNYKGFLPLLAVHHQQQSQFTARTLLPVSLG